MMIHLLQDPTFWVLLSTVLFFGFIVFKGRHTILAGLDARSQAIANRIDEANRLKKEAEEVLALFKAKNDSATVEAANLLQDAKDRTSQMEQSAEADLARAIARIQENASLRIKQAEQAAINTVRAQVIKHTRRLAEQQLAGQPASFGLQGLTQLGL